MKKIVLICILFFSMISVGVRAAYTNNTYLPIINKVPATPTPTRTPTPTNTPMPTPTQTPIPGAVQILPLSYAYVSNDTMYVVGEVLNDTSDTLSFVDVFVNFFDAGGQLVGTNHPDGTYLWPLDLPASERGCFLLAYILSHLTGRITSLKPQHMR